jgi:hypothetical protein
MGDINKDLLQRRWMSYRAAQFTVQDYGIKSARQYRKWWMRVKPKCLPKIPDKVYPEWVSWPEFLGTEHEEFTYEGKDFIQFWDAVKVLAPMKIQSREEYAALAKNGKIPENIPRSPHRYAGYANDWKGWNLFLSKERHVSTDRSNVRRRLRRASDIKTLMIFHDITDQPNVFIIKVFMTNRDREDFLANARGIRYMRGYLWDNKYLNYVNQLLRQIANGMGGDKFLIQNLNAFVFELEAFLMPYTEAKDAGGLKRPTTSLQA